MSATSRCRVFAAAPPFPGQWSDQRAVVFSTMMEHRGFMWDFIDIIGQVVDKMSHSIAPHPR
jgi:hypothetical protein